MAWTSPRTWVAGEKPTAATFNLHIRDNFKAIGDPWTSYTPSWTAATTNPTIGNGSIVGAFSQAGKLVNFRAQVTMGSTTTFGSGLYSLTLPVAPTAYFWTFMGVINDASGGLYEIVATSASGTSIELRCDSATAGNALRNVTASAPITWASLDSLFVSGTYEAA